MTLVIPKTFLWNETVWNPSMITTALWLDAADSSTIFQSSGAVDQWRDKTGNSRNATASSTARPTYELTSFNGKPGISFNGSSHTMVQSAAIYDTQWFGIVFVKTAKTAQVFGAGDLSPAAVLQTSTDIRIEHNTNALFTGFTNAPAILCSNKTLATWNGALMTASGSANSLISLHIGSRTGDSLFYDGVIAEIVVFTTPYSDSARQKLEGYLAHKWGLEANLPSNHPFKNYGPKP